MLYQAKGGRLDFCLEKLCLNPGELAEGFEQEFKRWESLTRLGHEHGLCVGVLVAQGPLSMGFSRQEYWSGLSCPSPGDFPTQGLNLGLLHCRQILYCLSPQGSPLNPLASLKLWPSGAHGLRCGRQSGHTETAARAAGSVGLLPTCACPGCTVSCDCFSLAFKLIQ